jgi:hypothetical protein
MLAVKVEAYSAGDGDTPGAAERGGEFSTPARELAAR